jgi:hypothetical protein
MEKYIIYYRNSNGNTETFRVTARSDYDAYNRFHKSVGYYPIVNMKKEAVAPIQQVG